MASRAPLLLGTLWVAAACVATGVGLAAVHLVAGEVGDAVTSPLSPGAVRQALDRTPLPSHTPGAAATSLSPGRLGPVGSVTSGGGDVGARCEDGEPTLLYATANQGYRAEHPEDATVRFVGNGRTVTVTLSCTGTTLRTHTSTTHGVAASSQPTPGEGPEESNPEPSSTGPSAG